MRTFDRETWVVKANERRNKSKIKLDLKSINSLQRLVDWCNERDVSVHFDSKTCGGRYWKKSIVINAGARATQQLHLLLHEIGHYLVDVDGTSKQRHSRGYQNVDIKDPSMHFKVDTLEEEYEAWQRGFNLANDLELDIDVREFMKTKVKNVKTYIMWAAGLLKEQGE